jgi:hypothetical protein
MKKQKLVALFTAALIIAGSTPAQSVQYIDTRMVDGIKIQSPTRVQAGKYFQTKLISKRGKISGICWWDWQVSKGFTGPSNFKMKKGAAMVRILPSQPGAGRMSFICGTDRDNPKIGGSADIYIAP